MPNGFETKNLFGTPSSSATPTPPDKKPASKSKPEKPEKKNKGPPKAKTPEQEAKNVPWLHLSLCEFGNMCVHLHAATSKLLRLCPLHRVWSLKRKASWLNMFWSRSAPNSFVWSYGSKTIPDLQTNLGVPGWPQVLNKNGVSLPEDPCCSRLCGCQPHCNDLGPMQWRKLHLWTSISVWWLWRNPAPIWRQTG